MGRGNRKLSDLGKLGRFGIGDGTPGKIERAGFGRRQRLVRRPAGLLERLEDGGGIGIEGYGHVGKNLLVLR